MSSGDKRKHTRERRRDGLKIHTSEDIDVLEEEKINNIYSQYAGDSTTRRTPTPTKQITLQAIRRKPEYSQNENHSSVHQRAPPLIRPSSASRRTPTPTKHVTLQAIRRKSDNYSDRDSFDLKEFNSKCHNDVVLVSTQVKGKQIMSDSSPQRARSSSQLQSPSSSSAASSSSGSMATTVTSEMVPRGQMSKVKDQESKPLIGDKRTSFNDVANNSDSDQYDTDLNDEDDSSDDDDEDDEPLRAPNELMMEFLACIMQKDYKNAQKLCKMILLYEPENPEALSFQPLIQHKVDRAEAGEETSSSDDDTDDSEDDTGDADSAGSDSDEDSGEESEDNSSKESSDDNENEDDDGDDDDNSNDEDDDDNDDDDRVTDSGLGSVSDMTH